MELATRSLITVGAAAIGAGLITAVPATAPPQIESPAVQLAADGDFFSLWADILDRAFTNVTALGTELVTPPIPVLQQVVVNQVGFLQDFFHDPADIWHIFGQLWGNLVTGVTVPFEPDTDLLDTAHRLAFASIAALVPADDKFLNWLVDFTASPVSGWLWGEVGALVSPWLELRDSLSSMIGAIGDGDWSGVWNDLVNIPAHMTDGWLNGYGTIDLTDLVGPMLPDLPIGTIRSVSVDLGGLLSPGGALFGGVGADVCTSLPFVGCVSVPPFPISGTDVGPRGSLIGMSHTIAQALGWDGTGNPISALVGGATATGAATDLFGGDELWLGAQEFFASLGL